MSKDNQVAVVENNPIVNFSPETLIAQAIDKSLPVETMERLLAMRTQLKMEWAKEQFDKAMAAFQAECPIIVKTKEVIIGGKVAYRYAPIESIVHQVKELLQKHGFSYSTQTINEETKVKAVCIIKHTAGHSEDYGMEVPLGPQTGMMSASQRTAAATTFAKRYAFCNAFGILSSDEDLDGAEIVLPNASKASTSPVAASITPNQGNHTTQSPTPLKNDLKGSPGLVQKIKDIVQELDPTVSNGSALAAYVLKVTGMELSKTSMHEMILTRLTSMLEKKKEEEITLDQIPF